MKEGHTRDTRKRVLQRGNTRDTRKSDIQRRDIKGTYGGGIYEGHMEERNVEERHTPGGHTRDTRKRDTRRMEIQGTHGRGTLRKETYVRMSDILTRGKNKQKGVIRRSDIRRRDITLQVTYVSFGRKTYKGHAE